MKNSNAIFLREYCKNYREIGSIVPDSKRCIDVMLRYVPFESAKVIVEFGAASGAVTREIVRRKKHDTAFYSFEKNVVFFNRLNESIAGENVFLVNANVFESAAILMGEHGIDLHGADCIVSTLPCSNIDVNRLLRQSVFPLLTGGGLFVQYVHVVSIFKGFHLERILSPYFNQIIPVLVIGNIPPAIIYNCRNLMKQ